VSDLEAVIGVEIHVQLSTRTKMFCGCELSFGDPPNTHTCPVCLAHPGVLPVVNEEAVRRALVIGLALGCEIAPRSIFHRKNYFYPDLPKAYQISQFDIPICGRGEFVAIRDDGSELRVGITRAHLEEDAAKLTHAGGRRAGAEGSVVDFNRGGTPLVEIVTEPDLRSAADTAIFLRQLRQTLLFLGVSDCSMEEGSMRADANVSVRPVGSPELGTKTELKNMNSFRFLERGIDAELARQREIIASGGRVSQETVHYEPDTGSITSLRSKEESHDYRYFPEPDLVPVVPDLAWVEELRTGLPDLPIPLRRRLVDEMGLTQEDAAVITGAPELVAYFMEAASLADPKACANWIRGELRAQLRETGQEPWESRVTPSHVAALVGLLAAGTVSVPAAKEVLAGVIETGDDPAAVVEARGLGQMDDGELSGIVAELVAANPDQAQQLRDGKEKVIGFFVGQAMKRTGGRADPSTIQRLVRATVAGE
jgi:aspartyl-tRNA(Asn)/glutamyl-tRNA(Gln) amidotransferase subunit B